MPVHESEWTDTLLHLLALASRLEGEGQYNLAKLARAAADLLSRQAIYPIAVPAGRDELANDIRQAAAALSPLGASAELLSASGRAPT